MIEARDTSVLCHSRSDGANDSRKGEPAEMQTETETVCIGRTENIRPTVTFSGALSIKYDCFPTLDHITVEASASAVFLSSDRKTNMVHGGKYEQQ